MYARAEFFRERGVYELMSLDGRNGVKALRDDHDFEVRLGALGDAMHVAFVDDLKVGRGEGSRELFFDTGLNRHAAVLPLP